MKKTYNLIAKQGKVILDPKGGWSEIYYDIEESELDKYKEVQYPFV